VLVGKLALFAAMLGLAAANRFRLTPALAAGLASGSPDQALNALRKSVLIESAAALAVIVLVSILGTLAPPSSMG
jgi:putative copper resistance protein D